MQIFVTDVAAIHPRVQAQLYTALELLRLCVKQADDAVESLGAFTFPEDTLLMDWDDGECDVDVEHLRGIQSVCRVHALMLQEVASGVPQLPERVFRDLPAYRGSEYDPPHLGAIAMTLRLAAKHIREAMRLSAELDGEEWDDFFDVMQAAYLGVQSEANCLESSLRGCFLDKDLDAILAGTYSRELATA